MMGRVFTRIFPGELTLLLITLVGATAILYAPAMSVREAGQDGWLSLLLPATLYGLLVVWVTSKLPRCFPGLTFGQYTERLVGKWLSRVLGLLYALYIFMLLAVIVREFGNFLSVLFMPETPLAVFGFSLIILASFAAIGGVEVISRMNLFLLPLTILITLLMFPFLLKDVELSRLLPVLEQGIWPVLHGSLVPSAFRGEVFVLMWLVYHLEKPQDSTRAGVWAVLILALILALDAIAILAVMGKELASRQVFPTLTLVRYINIGIFINRVEGVVMVVWVAGVMIKCSVLFYVVTENAVETFGFKGSRWYLILPIGLVLLLVSLYSTENDYQLIWFMKHILPPVSFVFQLFLPAFLLLLASRGEKGAGSYG